MSSDKRSLQKIITKGIEQNIKLKKDTNILFPVLMMRNDVNLNNYNYCYIEELKRYYFIKQITQINNKIISLELECDVLETYKNSIAELRGLIYRKPKTGDFYAGESYGNVNSKVTTYSSDVILKDDQQLILSTVGV